MRLECRFRARAYASLVLVLALFPLLLVGCGKTTEHSTKTKVDLASVEQKVYVGSLDRINEVALSQGKTLLEAIAKNGGIDFPEHADKQLMFLVRRGFPENESRIFLPVSFVRTSLGGRFELEAGDLVLLSEKLDASAFALGAEKAGAEFSVAGMVQNPGEFQTNKAVTKVEDVLTAAYAGASTSDDSHFDMIVYKTVAADGVPETYYLPMEEPFLERLYLKVRIKNDDAIEFVCAKQMFQAK